jgi:hypothetical protein
MNLLPNDDPTWKFACLAHDPQVRETSTSSDPLEARLGDLVVPVDLLLFKEKTGPESLDSEGSVYEREERQSTSVLAKTGSIS